MATRKTSRWGDSARYASAGRFRRLGVERVEDRCLLAAVLQTGMEAQLDSLQGKDGLVVLPLYVDNAATSGFSNAFTVSPGTVTTLNPSSSGAITPASDAVFLRFSTGVTVSESVLPAQITQSSGGSGTLRDLWPRLAVHRCVAWGVARSGAIADRHRPGSPGDDRGARVASRVDCIADGRRWRVVIRRLAARRSLEARRGGQLWKVAAHRRGELPGFAKR